MIARVFLSPDEHSVEHAYTLSLHIEHSWTHFSREALKESPIRQERYDATLPPLIAGERNQSLQ